MSGQTKADAAASDARAVILSVISNDYAGGRTRARTWDPLIKSQLLYQLSYAPAKPAGAGL